MLGHPEDVPGGPLVSNEATVYERKQRAKREAAAAADPQLALEQRLKEERRQAEKRDECAARHKVRRGKRCALTADHARLLPHQITAHPSASLSSVHSAQGYGGGVGGVGGCR